MRLGEKIKNNKSLNWVIHVEDTKLNQFIHVLCDLKSYLINHMA